MVLESFYNLTYKYNNYFNLSNYKINQLIKSL